MSCSNCGHKKHCGKTCTQTYKDGDNKDCLLYTSDAADE